MSNPAYIISGIKKMFLYTFKINRHFWLNVFPTNVASVDIAVKSTQEYRFFTT